MTPFIPGGGTGPIGAIPPGGKKETGGKEQGARRDLLQAHWPRGVWFLFGFVDQDPDQTDRSA